MFQFLLCVVMLALSIAAIAVLYGVMTNQISDSDIRKFFKK